MTYKAEQIYQQFHQSGLTTDRVHFSGNWLGRSQNYLSTLKSRDAKLGPKTLIGLRFKIHQHLQGDSPFSKLSLANLDKIILEEICSLAAYIEGEKRK